MVAMVLFDAVLVRLFWQMREFPNVLREILERERGSCRFETEYIRNSEFCLINVQQDMEHYSSFVLPANLKGKRLSILMPIWGNFTFYNRVLA